MHKRSHEDMQNKFWISGSPLNFVKDLIKNLSNDITPNLLSSFLPKPEIHLDHCGSAEYFLPNCTTFIKNSLICCTFLLFNISANNHN